MSQVPSAQDGAPVPGGLNDYTCHIIPLSHIYLRPCQLRPPEHWALSLHSYLSSWKAHSPGNYSCFWHPPRILAFLLVCLGLAHWSEMSGSLLAPGSCPASSSGERLPAALLGDPPHLAFLAKQVSGSHDIDPLPWKHLWVYNSPTQAPSQSAGSLHPPWDREEGRKQMATPFQAQSEVGFSCF